MRPDVSHIGLAVDTSDGGSYRWKRPPLGGRTRLVLKIIHFCLTLVVNRELDLLWSSRVHYIV